MKKILVTGGAGNVAGALVKALVKNPDNFVVVVDSLRTGSEGKLPSAAYTNWKFIKANVNHFDQLAPIMREEKFNIVFHYAALVGVQRTLQNPLEVLSDIDGIKYMLQLSVETGVKKVFYSSSSEVYGEPVEFPQIEDTTPLNAKLPYAIVKNVGEAFLKSYYKEHGLPFTIFRFFNTYGPDQSEDFVMAKFIRSAMRGDDITIYGDGGQTRTFCFVDDNIETTIKILEQDLAQNDVLNVGSDRETSILELAQMCIAKTNSSSKIIHLPALEEGDMTRRQPDIAKMKAILNRPIISLEEGMDRMIAHYAGK